MVQREKKYMAYDLHPVLIPYLVSQNSSKSKFWEPFRSYQLNSTANPAHLPQNWAKFEVNGLDWQCCLAGSSKRAPRIFIFSIVLGAENLSYVKSIETHVRAFLPLNISAISSVGWDGTQAFLYVPPDLLYAPKLQACMH